MPRLTRISNSKQFVHAFFPFFRFCTSSLQEAHGRGQLHFAPPKSDLKSKISSIVVHAFFLYVPFAGSAWASLVTCFFAYLEYQSQSFAHYFRAHTPFTVSVQVGRTRIALYISKFYVKIVNRLRIDCTSIFQRWLIGGRQTYRPAHFKF